MRSTIASFVVCSLLAMSGYAQPRVEPHSPDEPDPHENPIGQKPPASNGPDTRSEPIKPLAPIPPAASGPQGSVKIAPVETEDAIIGTWVLVPEKSHLPPDAKSSRVVRTYTRTAEGIQATVTRTSPAGSVSRISYPWRVDGKEYAVIGSPLLDRIVLKPVDNLTAEATLKHGGVVLAAERRQMTADGATMTITVQDFTSAEHPVNSVEVYRRAENNP